MLHGRCLFLTLLAQLVRLPDSLDNLTRLVSLRASRNKLTALPRALANMRLVELNFADNLIEEVPEFFTTSRLRTTLRTLLLHSNHIAEVCVCTCQCSEQLVFKTLLHVHRYPRTFAR